MNSIDILEKMKQDDENFMEDVVIYNLEKFIRYCNNSSNFEYDYDFKQHKEVGYLISTLIAENKELKEEKEELKRENREIRNWKYTIDTYEDLDLLKRLDIIKIKGKEYIDKNLYDELKKDKKALINNYSKVLGEFISKDKIKAKIEPKLKELDKNMKKEWQEYGNSREYQDMEDEWNFLQSLLGKE